MNGGNGTLAPSYAIAEYLNQIGNQTKVFDIMAEANPMGEMLCNVYNFLLKKSLLSASIYMEFAHAFPIDKLSLFNKLGSKNSEMIINKEQPDAILLICPWISRMTLLATEACNNNDRIRPMVFVDVVDLGYGMTTSWVNNDVDFTFLSTTNAYNYLTTEGLNENQAEVLGVPLSNEFAGGKINAIEKRKARAKFVLNNDDLVITILGGREGGIYTEKILIRLMKDLPYCRFMVQCGLNQTLFSRINKIAYNNKNVHALGFVKSMRELYATSDIVITKPGAITVSELIVSKVPFIINAWPAVMPQERGNVEFVTENTLGCVAHSVQELPKLVRDNMDCKYVESLNNEIREKLYGTKKIGDKIVSLIKEHRLD